MDWIDLRSDTVTRPTAGMREAMARADVGDDVFGEDPTVNALQERVAQMAGKERALFVPSGTMANILAVLSQTRPGDAVLLHRDAHPFQYESGNLGAVAGVLPITLDGAYGMLDPQAVAQSIELGQDHHRAPTRLIMLENTTNRGGGAIYPLEVFRKIHEVAKAYKLKIHCDGARIFNAIVETGHSLAEYAKYVDTLSFCFSKGLGAPVGSVLIGNAEVIDRAHRYRKMLGGGMRQAGILAAAALYALDHHIERLREDHRRARTFYASISHLKGLTFPMPIPTNIVFIDVEDANRVAAQLAEERVLVLPVASRRLRVVFHLEIDDEKLERAIEAFKRICSTK